MNRYLLLLFCVELFTSCGISDSSQTSSQTPIGIDTSYFVSLGEVKQYIEIKGPDKQAPVLLFLHGGPGWPATPMIRMYNQDLAEDINIVSWDQRGCGNSTRQVAMPTSMGFNQFVLDAHELTQHLKEKFDTDKIYLAAHSWGSAIGLHLVSEYPSDYHAYIGMGQLVDQTRKPPIARTYLLEQATQANDTATLNYIHRLKTNTETQADKDAGWYKEGMLLWTYRGNDWDTVYEAKAMYAYDDYKELDWMAAVEYAMGAMKDEPMPENFWELTQFEVPMYFFVGSHDYNTPYVLVEEYFQRISAPKKALFWFDNSGHSPQWEEPQLFRKQVLAIIEAQ